jgi:hypothetical protein
MSITSSTYMQLAKKGNQLNGLKDKQEILTN